MNDINQLKQLSTAHIISLVSQMIGFDTLGLPSNLIIENLFKAASELSIKARIPQDAVIEIFTIAYQSVKKQMEEKNIIVPKIELVK